MAPYITCPISLCNNTRMALKARVSARPCRIKQLVLASVPAQMMRAASSLCPDNIPVLRWTKSGVSIVEFLGDKVDSSDWDADELDGVAEEADNSLMLQADLTTTK